MKLELIFAFFALLGAIDKLIGDRFRLGQAFEKGLMTAGPLILSMAGMIVLSPVLADGMSKVLTPICAAIGMELLFLPGSSRWMPAERRWRMNYPMTKPFVLITVSLLRPCWVLPFAL